MIVTIGGHPGSGKGTVGRLIASRLGYEYYSMGDIWGETAKKHGKTLNEFHAYLREHPEFDRELDAYQESLGKQDALVIESRLAHHFVPHAFKIFLIVEPTVGAKRILSTERGDEKYSSAEEAIRELKERAENERKQYMAIYNTDHYNLTNYDLVIDTTNKTPQEVADEIIIKTEKLN